jgi:hypothetical protein
VTRCFANPEPVAADDRAHGTRTVIVDGDLKGGSNIRATAWYDVTCEKGRRALALPPTGRIALHQAQAEALLELT